MTEVNYGDVVIAVIMDLLEDENIVITDETALIGDGSVLDSMKLVELCVALEDRAAELGSEFDWTSDSAMSMSRSMFRTAGSLTAEFGRQIDLHKDIEQ